MKRLITLLFFCLPFCLPMLAGEPCDILIKEAKTLYKKGQYFSAKERFKKIKNECEYYDRTCEDYIDSCEARISAEKQHQRMLEARYKKEKGEKEYKERIERRNRNRLVYLSVNNDVPGSFRGIEKDLKNSLEWAKDSLDAFWFVRLVTTINETELGCYHVEAYVEIENAIDSVPKTVSYYIDAEDCGSKEKVANLIYESKSYHLFKDIEENIKKKINANDTKGTVLPSDKDTVLPSDSKVENVVIYVVPQSCPIAEPLEHCLSSNLNSKYLILNRDKEKNDFLEKEFDYQEEGYVKWNQRTSKNNRLGVDKVCVVKITERNEGLWFLCSMIGLETDRIDVSPITDAVVKVKPFSGIDRIQIVADELTRRLGIPSENFKDLDERIEKAKGEDSKAEKDALDKYNDSICKCKRRAFIPRTGELVLAGAATTALAGWYISKSLFDNTHQPGYGPAANVCSIVSPICMGAAIVVYSCHICKAWPKNNKKGGSSKGGISLNPVVTNETMALSLSINF